MDFLKNKEESDKAKEKKVAASLPVEKENSTKKVKVKKESLTTKNTTDKTKAGNFSYDLVREPLLSEKSNYLSAQNKYIFRVVSGANKPEIKKSIEGIYGVNVLSVNMLNTNGKKRRVGRIEGFKKGFRKAIVTIKEGQKIEIF